MTLRLDAVIRLCWPVTLPTRCCLPVVPHPTRYGLPVYLRCGRYPTTHCLPHTDVPLISSPRCCTAPHALYVSRFPGCLTHNPIATPQHGYGVWFNPFVTAGFTFTRIADLTTTRRTVPTTRVLPFVVTTFTVCCGSTRFYARGWFACVLYHVALLHAHTRLRRLFQPYLPLPVDCPRLLFVTTTLLDLRVR